MADAKERLQECRRRSGLSYSNLEGLTSYSRGHLSDVHNGNREVTTDVALSLAPIYKTTPKWLQVGEPKVNIWEDFQCRVDFKELGKPVTSSGKRAAAVLRYLHEYYHGHLRYTDVANLVGIDYEVITGILEGRTTPAEGFMQFLQDLSGVPAAWLEIGHFALVADLFDGPTAERLHKLLIIGAKAEAAEIPIEVLEAFVDQTTALKR